MSQSTASDTIAASLSDMLPSTERSKSDKLHIDHGQDQLTQRSPRMEPCDLLPIFMQHRSAADLVASQVTDHAVSNHRLLHAGREQVMSPEQGLAALGYSSLRPAQKPLVDAMLQGLDLLAVMQTGGGKTLCFTLPALIVGQMVVVLSPLIALMSEQYAALTKLGLSACCLGGGKVQDRKALQSVANGDVQFLLLSPEKLLSSRTVGSGGVWHAIEQCDKNGKLFGFVVDEAHVLTEWSFRPKYRQLHFLREAFPATQIAAFTATAAPHTVEDIQQTLRFRATASRVVIGDVLRKNLFLEVRPRRVSGQPGKELLQLLQSQEFIPSENSKCIIYVDTRSKCDQLSRKLQKLGYHAVSYHAGLGKAVRKESLDCNPHIVCATIAFGLGVDLSDVRLVCHLSMPTSIERYHQETGRGSRNNDTVVCRCVAWVGEKDLAAATMRHRVREGARGGKSAAAKRSAATLDTPRSLVAVHGMLSDIHRCRHEMLSTYFRGVAPQLGHRCGHLCDNCKPTAITTSTIGASTTSTSACRSPRQSLVARKVRKFLRPCSFCGKGFGPVRLGRYGYYRRCAGCQKSRNLSPQGFKALSAKQLDSGLEQQPCRTFWHSVQAKRARWTSASA